MPQPLMPRKLKFKDSMKTYKTSSSVQFSPSVMSDSSLPHGLQHPRLGFPVQRQLPELTPKKKDIHSRGLECQSRKSRGTWSNRQIWPWSTEWSRAKANRVLPTECTGEGKQLLPTTQETALHMDVTRWSTLKSAWLYSLQPKMDKLYTVSKNKTGSWR